MKMILIAYNAVRKQLRIVFLWIFVFAGVSGAYAQTEENSRHILFIGNSYTYFHSMPEMFKAIASVHYPDDSIVVRFVGGGGATLQKHWEVGEALDAIQSGYWDFVVIQGQSMLGSTDLSDPDSPAQFFKYARKLDAEIKKSGAHTVFFMTWPRKNHPEQQIYLSQAYESISHELSCRLAPVGLVWEQLRNVSGIDLYMPDNSHPSVSGSYVAALTLFATIFDTIPENLSGTLYGHQILRGGKLSDDFYRLSNLNKKKVIIIKKTVNIYMNGK